LFRKLERENVLALNVPLRETMLLRGKNGLEHALIREVELPSQADISIAEKRIVDDKR
jgi:hypothetical protein